MELENLKEIVKLALAEDLKDRGDVTSRAIFKDDTTEAVLRSKDTGILAGIECFEYVFSQVDSSVSLNLLKKDGDALEPGDEIVRVTGKTASILEAERTAINILSLLSGIASITAEYVAAARERGNTVILDTRKTIPGFRELSKYAVKVGGGQNHRMGLFDMVMIKDNHHDAAGSITKAVAKVREAWGDEFKIEVECRNIDEVKEAISLGVDIIMLDNMTTDQVKEALAVERGDIKYESSGNMNLDKIKEYSSLGVDFISVGRLTHSVESFDFSLQIK